MNEDESALSEITILPDGRVYVFGITAPIAELLHELTSRETARAQLPAEAALQGTEEGR